MNLTGKKLQTGFCTLAVLLTASLAAVAQKTTSYQEYVTTVVFDTDSTGAQTLVRSDDSNAAGQATYTTTTCTGHCSSISSQIESNGEWQLLLYGQSVRTLWITPNDAINSSQPAAPPAGYYSQNVEAYSRCLDQNGNIVPFENLVNSSGNCTLGVDFGYGGVVYKLLMNLSGKPVDSPSSCPSTGCPATGLATVTCNAVSNSKCVSWTITPNMTAPNPTVASLFSYTGPVRTPWVYVGQYYNSFRISVTNP